MEIVNARIDERLIHGQIVTVWIEHLKADRIIIVDDKAASDEIQKMMLKIACPSNVRLSILSIKTGAEKYLANEYGGDKVFLIFHDPSSVKKFTDFGCKLKTLNVGNMSGKVGSIQVKKAVSISSDEATILRELSKNGVEITAKMVPNDPDIDLIELIRNI